MSKTNPQQPSLHVWLGSVSGRIADTMKAMIERNARLIPAAPSKLSSGDFDKLLPDGPVAVTIRLSVEGGAWHILLPRKLAAGLADLAAMGEGNAPFDEAAHPGVLKEIFGQIAADLAADLGEVLNDAGQVSGVEISLEGDSFIAKWGGDQVVVWKLEIENWGEDTWIQLLERPFSSYFAEEAVFEEPLPVTSSHPEPVSPAPKPRGPVVSPAAFEEFEQTTSHRSDAQPNIDSLLDISLPISIELGRTRMLIREVLDLGPGSVIELDKLSGEPVDLFVNDKKFARGEVVVIEENFGVRITELLKVDERIKALR